VKLNARTSHPALPANRLLAGLPAQQRSRLTRACEQVELQAGDILMHPGTSLAHAWFPLDAVVSLRIADMQHRQACDVALVGWEGMVGVPLVLGADSSALSATVMRRGAALRITAPALRQQLADCGPLQDRLHRYVHVSMTQLAQASLCTRYHVVDERLARWLLMTQDRIIQGALYATHDFLGSTLGVRRAGITRAAAGLQERELISYRRGVLNVTDRAGLQAAACACYASDRAHYAALLGQPGRPPRHET
jgi:CRP-like cAMP-binding protein